MTNKVVMTSKKLLNALNTKGYNITFTTRQYMDDSGRPRDYYSLYQNMQDENTGKYVQSFLYGAPSRVRILLFLRDLWYIENGWELPTDDPKWNAIRATIIEQRKDD